MAKNLEGLSYELGMTEFADLTTAEFANLYLMPAREHPAPEPDTLTDVEAVNKPDAINWVCVCGRRGRLGREGWREEEGDGHWNAIE